MGKIVFSQHVLYQMKERKISKTEVTATLSRPDYVIEQSMGKFQSVKLVKRNRERYALVVIWRKVNSNQKAITAFLTSKIKKYFNK